MRVDGSHQGTRSAAKTPLGIQTRARYSRVARKALSRPTSHPCAGRAGRRPASAATKAPRRLDPDRLGTPATECR